MELFSALDNALSQKAQDTLTEFAAVKKADVQLQTQLGNRKGQIAANVIGAFAESQNSAFGWQLRGYGAENNNRGANAGIFFRRLDGESLYGINSFVDYESGKYGDFLRYGIGGELQNRYAAFAANLYLPITDDKHKGSTVAFSQKGYDANLRINIPQFDFLKVRADYYHYSGEYGVENDKGFRYGLELQPINNLRIGAFYDDGGEKFGGDIAYIYDISPPQKRESTGFAPDLFSPVLREYSQRITTAETTPFAFITTAITTTGRITTSAMTTAIFSTMAGLRTTTYMTAAGLTATRMASVHFTARFDGMAGAASYSYVATTQFKYLITLPPVSELTTPLFITLDRDFSRSASEFRIIESNHALFVVGDPQSSPPGFSLNLTATITEGSEDFVSVATTLTTGTTRMTAADVITETGMMTMMAMTSDLIITTFTTTRITITATIGAAKVDSHLPPSFPLSFPPFPQVPKLALAAIPRPPIVIPAPAYARADNGGNQLAAGQRILRRQSRR